MQACRIRPAQVVSASVTAAFSAGTLDQLVAVSSVSHNAPADSSESRRYGALKRPCSHAFAGASPSEVPPLASIRRPRLGMPALDVVLGALEHGDRQATAGDGVLADALGGGQVHAGFGLVGEPQHRRAGPGLDDGAQGVGARGEVGERPRFVAGGRRRRVNLDADAGDDAEHAFGADQQLAQVRARRGLRCAAEVEHARRGDRAQAADHVVESPVARRVLPGRSGRGESADRRELEALREVPEREAAFAEQAFGVRTR